MTLRANVGDSIRALDELELDVTDGANAVLWEFSGRTDGRKEGSNAIDWTGKNPVVRIQGSRSEPLNSFQDEDDYATAFAIALNARDERSYIVEPKDKEDSDFVDRWLRDDAVSKDNPAHRVAIQVTHLDKHRIKELGTDGKYAVQIDADVVADAAVEALRRKSKIDMQSAGKTYLILITPYPIRESLQSSISDAIRSGNPESPYRETWIVPFREKPFKIL